MKLDNQKLYLLKKRDDIMRQLSIEGFNGNDIGIIFNLNRSTVSDVIKQRNKRDKIRKE